MSHFKLEASQLYFFKELVLMIFVLMMRTLRQTLTKNKVLITSEGGIQMAIDLVFLVNSICSMPSIQGDPYFKQKLTGLYEFRKWKRLAFQLTGVKEEEH
jgi:hypothetical protein